MTDVPDWSPAAVHTGARRVPMADTTANDSREPEAVRAAARRRMAFSPWNLLLLIPLIATLFFYWYQMVAIPGSVILTLIVYSATRGER
jgi:hypothetical protein